MPFLLSLLAPVLAQVGPAVTPGAAPPLPHERRVEESNPARTRQPGPPPGASPTTRQEVCLELATMSPAEAEEAAQAWLDKAKGPEQALAGECLGIALTRQDRWSDARAVFLVARDAASDPQQRARLGAMAANAALAQGDAKSALAILDTARDDAQSDAELAGGIALDRARALVALNRTDDGEAALAEARRLLPENAQAWLLSATLSRRLGKLVEAQSQIERAAELLPVDPEIGLEAGVIAMLAGREDAARKSWQSVIAAAPQSETAVTARDYLAQLDGPQAAQP